MNSLLTRFTPPIVFSYIRDLGWILLGVLILCTPTIIDLYNTVWQGTEQAHGPFVLAIVAWLFYKSMNSHDSAQNKSNPLLGGIFFALGSCLYIFGRSQEIWLFEVGGFIPLFIGMVLILCGKEALKKYLFAISFVVFLIPLPSVIVDALTGGLKNQVSHLAEVILYAANYPIGRAGVMLVIGQYQLLVADACSGMNSMFSLFAMGLLYIYINGYGISWRSIILFLCVVPIAFVGNVVRVIILILVTYHYGDAAGQGFVHDFAGMIIFSIALISLFLVDFLLGILVIKKVKQ